jgi:cyclopropane-fatty-acyl-phospholipid synthase
MVSKLDKFFYQKLFKNLFSDTCKVRFWDGEEIKYGDGDSKFTIILNEPIPEADIIFNPSVAFGDAYMYKKLEIEGSVQDVIESMYNNKKSFLVDTEKYGRLIKPIKNTISKSKENVSFHYDLGNDFYEIWLDKSMTYSCAYFKTEEDSLEQAQKNKVDYTLKKLNLEEGNTLLDIGCGWGQLVIAAAKEYKVKALGITLSNEQKEMAEKRIKAEGLCDYVQVEICDYRQLKNIEFDRIVSVGMLEHVGKKQLKEFFSTTNRLLKKGGISLIHSITGIKEGGSDPWIDKYIFPGSYIPSVSEIIDNIGGEELHLLDVESLRRHYGKTLEKWADNFEKSMPQIREMKDETFIRMWRLYLNSTAASFNTGAIDIHQFLFSKGIADGIPWTRDYLYR